MSSGTRCGYLLIAVGHSRSTRTCRFIRKSCAGGVKKAEE
jgi:hypothetical protein